MRLFPVFRFCLALLLLPTQARTLAAESAAAGEKPKLFVFYPSLARPLAIQDALARKCQGLRITVFGRLADFQAKVAAEAPDAVLAPPVVLKQFAGYGIALQGLRKGSQSESYVLLSLEKAVDPARLDGVNIGVVGLLERKPMGDFVQTLVTGAPRLDRVTKVEDLLPLLTFHSVSAVLVSETVAKEFAGKSQAPLVSTRLERARVGLVAVGVGGGAAGADVTKALRGLGNAELELPGGGRMEMKRLAVPAMMCAALAIAGTAQPALRAVNAPAATAAPEPQAAVAVKATVPVAQDAILVLRAEDPKFDETMRGLREELGEEFDCAELILRAGTDARRVDSAVAALRPKAVVLMDNLAISLYARMQAAWKDPVPYPPSISLLAVRVDKAIAGMKHASGIFYEVPGVTISVNLRSLVKDPVRKVGVIHRPAMADMVKENAKWCAAENIELVPYMIPESMPEGDVARAVRTGVRRLWRKDAVDALWVLNDNFYLTPEIIAEGWLPALEHFEKPVLVGVENFVSSGTRFGTFAVLPDHYGLGAQAAGMVLRLKEDGWETPEEPVLRQPLAIYKVLNLRLARKYSGVNDDRLKEIDRVVK